MSRRSSSQTSSTEKPSLTGSAPSSKTPTVRSGRAKTLASPGLPRARSTSTSRNRSKSRPRTKKPGTQSGSSSPGHSPRSSPLRRSQFFDPKRKYRV